MSSCCVDEAYMAGDIGWDFLIASTDEPRQCLKQ